MNEMRIEFGTLQNYFGTPAAQDGLSIVPAMVELNGTGRGRRAEDGRRSFKRPQISIGYRR